MKKLTLLILLAATAIVACKKKSGTTDPVDPPQTNPGGNHEQPNPETASLPQKIVMTSGGETWTYTISYQSNTAKIDKITRNDGMAETYLYDGNLITKKTTKAEDYDVYTYTSEKLTTEENYRGNKSSGKIEFNYSGSKTTATFKEYNENEKKWEEGVKVEFNYNTKGNLADAKILAGGETAGQVAITYDDKNSPFLNVLGWAKIGYFGGAPLGNNIGFEDIVGIVNNPVKLTGQTMDEKTAKPIDVETNYSYEFKDTKTPKFPTKITGTRKMGTTVTFTAEITYK